MARGIDCCAVPSLAVVRVLYEKSHDDEQLQRCDHCQQWWFWRFHEWMNFNDGPDEMFEWYTRITADEAAAILGAVGSPNLSFLADREAIMIGPDNKPVRVLGQPTGAMS
jgi:hypothetical protein